MFVPNSIPELIQMTDKATPKRRKNLSSDEVKHSYMMVVTIGDLLTRTSAGMKDGLSIQDAYMSARSTFLSSEQGQALLEEVETYA